jgi:hypothetical protein
VFHTIFQADDEEDDDNDAGWWRRRWTRCSSRTGTSRRR